MCGGVSIVLQIQPRSLTSSGSDSSNASAITMSGSDLSGLRVGMVG